MRTQHVIRAAASMALAAMLATLTPLSAAAATHRVDAGSAGALVFAPRTRTDRSW